MIPARIYLTEDDKRNHLVYLVAYLLQERNMAERMPDDQQPANMSAEQLWTMFRALVNTREPGDADRDFIQAQDRLLQSIIAEQGVCTIEDTVPAPFDEHMRLWRGDITTLMVDAIVNAANSELLGCWQPGHHCIDNAIHTFAGVQLRRECAEIMRKQGRLEPTGRAKITGGWNLPAEHIIHTVGPIANGSPTDEHREQLASCYASCLDLAEQNNLHSIAFCSISTGVFGFPPEEAARIAIRTVRDWLLEHRKAGISAIFNVFSREDEAIYRKQLGM